jgi:DNA replication ATP-dependent helicase Dna2
MRLTEQQANHYFESLGDIFTNTGLESEASVLRLRQIFESIFKELLRDESTGFTTVFQRSTYVFHKTATPKNLVNCAHQFRQFANRFVHEGQHAIDQSLTKQGFDTIVQLVEHFSGCSAPHQVKGISTGNAGKINEVVDYPKGVKLVRGIVTDIKKGNHYGFTNVQLITCSVEFPNDINELQVILDEEWLQTPVWQFMPVVFTYLESIKKDAYRLSDNGSITILPDILLDATTLSSCLSSGQSALAWYWAKKLQPSQTSEPMVVGILVNNLFDQIVKNPEITFDQAYRNALQQTSVSFALLGACDENKIRERARSDFDVVKRNVRTRLENTRTELQPTFLSDVYGLQGRLDLLIYGRNSHPSEIIELKSGKPRTGYSPDDNVWPENRYQAAIYKMLLQEKKELESPKVSILYSQSKDQPTREVLVTRELEQSILQLRNQIVSAEWRFAQAQESVCATINSSSFVDIPQYAKDQVARLSENISGLSKYETAYFEACLRFVTREHLAARFGSFESGREQKGYAELWRSDLPTKRDSNAAIGFLQLYERKENSLQFRITESKTIGASSFRADDIVVLYRHDRIGNADPVKSPLMRGRIEQIDRQAGTLTVDVYSVTSDLKGDFWALEADMMDSAFDVLYRSMFAFASASKQKRDLILGFREPSIFKDNSSWRLPNYLTSRQKGILSKALAAKDYFLLQGPPGTGKTKYILKSLVEQLQNNTSDKILLLAFTNRAVNEICRAIGDVCDYVNLGSSNIQPDSALSSYGKSHTVDETRRHIRDARVVVSTVSTALSKEELIRLKKFDIAIVDEASQLLEPHLAGILSNVGRFILIGDQKQLPAVVIQHSEMTKVSETTLRDIGISDLRMSLFERLLDTCNAKGWIQAYGMLEEQGRMHNDIQNFPSRQFYDGRLTTINDAQLVGQSLFSGRSTNQLERMLSRSRMIFMPTTSKSLGNFNTQEAVRVVKVLECIRSRIGNESFFAQEVGVITPFRFQVAEIDSKMPSHMRNVVVDTVERYQGSERKVILYSMALNSPLQMDSIRALDSKRTVDRKLNVAITRAQQHFILLGNPDILYQDHFYKALLDYIRDMGGYADDINLVE